MHPILSERRVFVLYLVVWLVAGGLLSALLTTAGGLNLLEAASLSIPMMLVYGFMCLASYYLCRTFPLRRFDIARLLLIHAFGAALSSSLWISIGKSWVSLVAQLPPLLPLDEKYPAEIPLLFSVGISMFLLSIAVHYALIAFNESREAERQTMELRFHAQEAELRALRAQINPHFLFNSLNSVSALTTQDPQAARKMTLLLADFFRKSVSLGSQHSVMLEEELALAMNFLGIEQVRFGDRLRIELAIQDEAKRIPVPPLLLQPIIENAISHGIAHLVEGGLISIRADKRGNRLSIRIENPTDPDRPAGRGTGIGIENVRNRLKASYGMDARLETNVTPDRYRVEVLIPTTVPLSLPLASEVQV